MEFVVNAIPLEAIIFFVPKNLRIFVTFSTQKYEFDLSRCFTGYVQLKNSPSRRRAASCEGELILPYDAVVYVVRGFHNFTLGFL
jgi:hypothetical protein